VLSGLSVEKTGNAVCQFGGVSCLAFPDGQDVITQGAELTAGALIAGPVTLQLGEPVGVASGGDAAAATGVHVPEAAVDVDDLEAGGEDEVWGAWKGAEVEAEAEAEGVDEAADDHFRRRVLGLDGGHDAGTVGGDLPAETVSIRARPAR